MKHALLVGGFVAIVAIVLAACAIRQLSDYGLAPDFRLTDVAGGTFQLSAQPRKVVVLTFVAADCRDECPKVEGILRSAAMRLQQTGRLGRAAQIVTVEIDPRTNSIASVQALRRRLWPRAGWAFLRGDAAQTSALVKAYDVYVGPRVLGKDVVHASWVFVITRDLRERAILAPGTNLTTNSVVGAVDDAVADRTTDDGDASTRIVESDGTSK